VHIFLVKLRINQNLPRDRMLHQKSLEPFAEFSAVLGPIDESLIENHPDTHVTAFQWNPPTPPAIADHMIGGSITRRVNGAGP
jgi:hypothetical protein